MSQAISPLGSLSGIVMTEAEDFFSTTNLPTYVKIGGEWKIVNKIFHVERKGD